MTQSADRPAILYRFFDAADALLYVGITFNVADRWHAHAKRSWWGQVVRSTLEHFPTRDEAMAAERAAIKTEVPRHNIQGHPLNDIDRRRRATPGVYASESAELNRVIGAALKAARVRAGRTQEDVASSPRVRITQSTLSKIEQYGRPGLDFVLAARLAGELSVDLVALMWGSDVAKRAGIPFSEQGAAQTERLAS